MTKNIFEEESTSETQASGGDAKIRKQARQLAYDVRYKVKQSLKKGEESNDASLKRAYLQQLNSSPAPGAVKRVAKTMLVGESYDFVDITETAKESVDKILNNVFVKKTELEDADGNSAFEVTDFVFGEEKSDREKKYKVRVTDKKGKKTYVRMADRKKIGELRKGDEVSSVEMTGYGVPNEEKGKKKVVKKAKKDFDGDGKLESPEAEYKGSKDKAIKKAVASEGALVDVAKEAEKVGGAAKRKVKSGAKKVVKGTARLAGKAIKKVASATVRGAAGVVGGAVKGAVAGGYKGIKKGLTEEELKVLIQEKPDIADILARLEKKRISKGGNPDDSPLPAMKKYHAKKKKRVKKGDWIGPPPKKQETKEELEVDEGVLVNVAQEAEKVGGAAKRKIKSGAKKVVKGTARLAGKAIKKVGSAAVRGAAGVVGGAVKGAVAGGYKGIKKGLSEEELQSIIDNAWHLKEDYVVEVIEKDNPDANVKKIDVMKGKNKVKINPNMGEQVDPEKKDAALEQQSRKASMLKKRVLMQKLKAVRSGAGDSITASHVPEGEVVEGVIDIVKKGAKRHAKAVEKKKIKNRKAVPYAALGASYQPEGEVVEAAGCETKKIENKGKKIVDPKKNPVVDEGVKGAAIGAAVGGVVAGPLGAAAGAALGASSGTGKKRVAAYNKGREVVQSVKDKAKKVKNTLKGAQEKRRESVKSTIAKEEVVGEAKVDAGKSPETKEKDRNVRKFGVSHNVAGHGKLRRSLHRMNRGDKKIKGDKSAWTEMESVQVEAKQEQNRSDYGKASVRNKRAFGIEGEPEAISGSKERGKMIDARRYRHRTKRGIKKGDYKIDESYATAKKPSERAAIAKLEAILKRKEDLKKKTKGVKEEVIPRGPGGNPIRIKDRIKAAKGHIPNKGKPTTNEEADAYKYVVSKLKKKYGSGVLTKGDKIKPQSAADKAKARAHQAKVDAENAAERKKDPSQGRYPKGYSNRGSD